VIKKNIPRLHLDQDRLKYLGGIQIPAIEEQSSLMDPTLMTNQISNQYEIISQDNFSLTEPTILYVEDE